MKNIPDITVLPGGRKVRTDLRPYADEPVVEAPKKKRKPRAKKPKAEDE